MFYRTLRRASLAFCVLPGVALAAPLTAIEDGFSIGASPATVTDVNGFFFDGGFGPLENTIDGDLSTGAPNLITGAVLEFTFGSSLANAPGPDLVIIDARYDSAGLELSFDGGATFASFDADDFIDTGVSDALTSPVNTFVYDAFALLVDFSALGFTDTDTVDSFQLRAGSPGTGLDLIDVAAVTEVPPVPLPAAGWMLLAGLGGLGALRRRRG